ncbi:MAG: class I SAM-dependent methyltransferase, partial [Candidatus Bathyarchaeia archaeon]
MFYDFLAQRDKPGGETAVGSWNSRRCYVKQFEVLRQAEALKGEVLEIGPGEGIFARLCKQAGILYQGLERSAALQNRLKKEGFAVQLGTAPPLPFENERFDLVCAFAVLEHMPTFEQALGLLQECHRVLNRTGSLALIVPDYLRCGIGFFNWDYTHSFVTSPWRVRQILYDGGFDMVRLVHFTGSLTA